MLPTPRARRHLTAWTLLCLLLAACQERAQPQPQGFVPLQTRIPAAGVMLPFDPAEDAPVVPVLIDGKGPFRFLVDTGASHVVLDRRLVERLHLPRHGTSTGLRTAANAVVATDLPATIGTLALGQARFSALDAHVLDFAVMEIDGDMPLHIDGVLGSALFTQTLLTLDYPHRQLHLAQGSLPAPDGEEILPLAIELFMPHVLMRLETAGQVQDRLALIDTGSSSTIGISSTWGLDPATPVIEGGLNMTASGVVADHAARIARVRIGAVTWEAPEVDLRPGERAPRIGQSLLETMHVTFDFAGARLRLHGSTRALAVVPAWSQGFSAHPSRRPGREGRIVDWIAPGSPAAGLLRLGDRIVSINGQDVARMTNRTWSGLLLKDVELVVARADGPAQVRLPVFDALPWSPQEATALPPATATQAGAFALYSLADAYWRGHGVAIERAGALARCQGAAAQGDPGAQNMLATLTTEGALVARDDAAAFALFLAAAQRGLPAAQANVARMLGQGRGVTKDLAEAARWLRRAAAQGEAEAQNMLGRMLAHGAGAEPDLAQAVMWLRKAAEQNVAEAQNLLGYMLAQGAGVAKDEAAGCAWFKRAALQGHAEAQCNLGRMYGNGNGVPKDLQLAGEWLRKSADQGNAQAQHLLGRLAYGGLGGARDEAQAVAWYRTSADQGYAEAQCDLAAMYAHGRGVARDPAAALVWFAKAAEQGLAEAQSSLGILHATGQGTPVDEAQAVAWFRKAADQGHAQAQDNLGVCYATGRGQPKDIAAARAWFQKAADQDYAPARSHLQALDAADAGKPRDPTPP